MRWRAAVSPPDWAKGGSSPQTYIEVQGLTRSERRSSNQSPLSLHLLQKAREIVLCVNLFHVT